MESVFGDLGAVCCANQFQCLHSVNACTVPACYLCGHLHSCFRLPRGGVNSSHPGTAVVSAMARLSLSLAQQHDFD